MEKRGRLWMMSFMVVVTAVFPALAHADEAAGLPKGQSLYAPVYSQIYSGDRQALILLTATLSVRNSDPHHAMTVTRVDYYGTKGEMLKKYIEQRVFFCTLESTHSTHYCVPHKEDVGGAGGQFCC